MKRILVLIAITLSWLSAYGADIDWLTSVSDEQRLIQESKESGIYLRTIVSGDWGTEECYYEIMSNATLEELFDSPYGKRKKVKIFRVTTEGKEVRKIKFFELSGLIEFLAENDFFTLPRHRENKEMSTSLMRSPYSILIFSKVHETNNYVIRDNSHLVSYEFHQKLKELWD